MALQWKNGASWESIPAAALYSTWAGTYHVEYPPPQAVGIDGTQAAQTGKPRIVIKAPWMTDTGFDFWRDRFGSSTAETAAISIEAWEPRTGANVKWAGVMRRPTYESIGVGSTTSNTIYRNVTIEIWECATTT
jgi:hypothetical protein